MTDLYPREQEQTALPQHAQVLARSSMPSFHPPTRHRPFISKHLMTDDTEHDGDPDAICKEAFIVQLFQHWKAKTVEHQHALSSQGYATVSVNAASSESPTMNEQNAVSSGSIAPLQKRATPLVTTQARRNANFKKSLSTPADAFNPNLLAPHANTKGAPAAASTLAKKPTRPGPIFIAPKKSQAPSQPRPYAWPSLDELSQNKRKAISERPSGSSDDASPTSISPSWAPAPPRFLFQSSTSLYDDETSGEENDHESLLIRNRRVLQKPRTTNEKHTLSMPSHLIIPTSISITDPDGHSRVLDSSNDWMDEFANNERIVENDFFAVTPADYDHVFGYPSSASNLNLPPSPSSIDGHKLHSIGEEEEEHDWPKHGNRNGLILSKELDRIEAFSRSRQSILSVEKKDSEREGSRQRRKVLERRWSDSYLSDDDDDDHHRLKRTALVKMASTTSISKPAVTPPAKVSKTKYLLIKLHLAPSPTKDDDANVSPTTGANPPARKRTVRRATDKKRYQTR